MQCYQCGAQTVPGALYCHLCGARLDMPGRQTPPAEQQETKLAPDAGDSGPQSNASAAPSAPTAAERFREGIGIPASVAEDKEREVWEGSYSSRAMLANWVVSGLITLGLPIAGIYFGANMTWWTVLLVAILLLWGYQLLVLARRRLGVHYRLTSQRFFHEVGVLRHVIDRVEVIDIDDVVCEQGVFERLAGVGTIRIISSDRTHPELVLRGIENVRDVASLIDQTRHTERRRRGLFVEQI